jgi:HEPN domain-containing protein
MNRSKDWLSQSERDLKEAEWNLKGEFYEWSCFCAQQAAEKAVKALCEELGIERWGHAISRMLERIEDVATVPSHIMEKAKQLDRFYIPTRYPNGFESGAPMDYYLKKDAEESLGYAQEIIDFCKKKIQNQR